jgi:hypothetical protein
MGNSHTFLGGIEAVGTSRGLRAVVWASTGAVGAETVRHCLADSRTGTGAT